MAKQKKIFNFRPLFFGALALVLSISTAKFLFEGDLKNIIFIVVCLLAISIFCLCTKKFVSLLVLICFFGLGLGLQPLGILMFEGKNYVGEQEVFARVSDDISFSSYNNATIVLKDVFIGGKKDKNIRLTISCDNTSQIHAGDIISFSAEIVKAKIFELGEFKSFYLRDRTPYVANVDFDDVLLHGNRLNADENFRLKIKDVLNQNMGEDNASVAFAILFGDKSDMSAETLSIYNSAGLLHVLAVSGLHISFLFALLGFVLKKCHIKGWINFLICFAVLALYAWLCNFTPSVCRAGIMGLVLVFTRQSGKCYDGLSSIGLAGIIILLFSPLLALDLGFLLSFSCVISIYLLAPLLTKLFSKIFPKFVANAFAISFAVQIGTFPFIAKMSAGINFLFAFINLLIIPILSLVYPLLVIGGLFTAALPFFGFILKAAGFGLSCMKAIAAFFGQTHLALYFSPMETFFLSIFFVFLFLVSGFFMASKRTKLICCSAFFAAGALFYGLGYLQFPQKNKLAYAFNYGSSVVALTDENGQCALVDLSGESFSPLLLSRLGCKQAKTLFVLQDDTVDIELARTLGVQTIVRPESGEGYDEEVIFGEGETGKFGSFVFEYKFFANRLIGLEISLGESKIFILKDRITSANALQSLAKANYNFVLLGKHQEYATYFDTSQILTYNYCQNATTCYAKHGNVCYSINGNKNWRCLD